MSDLQFLKYNKMKQLFLIALLALTANVSAQWKYSISVDDFTDVGSIIPYVIGTGNDRIYDNPTIAYYVSSKSFAIIGSGYWSQDRIPCIIRIDKGEVYNVIASSSINNKTLFFNFNDKILGELMTGTKLLIKATGKYGSSNTMSFSLIGFTDNYSKAKTLQF